MSECAGGWVGSSERLRRRRARPELKAAPSDRHPPRVWQRRTAILASLQLLLLVRPLWVCAAAVARPQHLRRAAAAARQAALAPGRQRAPPVQIVLGADERDAAGCGLERERGGSWGGTLTASLAPPLPPPLLLTQLHALAHKAHERLLIPQVQHDEKQAAAVHV